MCNCKMASMQPSFGIFLPFCVQFHLLFYDLHLVLTDFISPKMPSKRFVKTGVVNLGALLRMSNFNRERQMCDDTLYDMTDVHLAQVRNSKAFLGMHFKRVPKTRTLDGRYYLWWTMSNYQTSYF